jgi:hypothetical protein
MMLADHYYSGYIRRRGAAYHIVGIRFVLHNLDHYRVLPTRTVSYPHSLLGFQSFQRFMGLRVLNYCLRSLSTFPIG